MLQASDDVVLVDELVAGVEAEDRGDGGQAEPAGVGGANAGSQDVREAQDGDVDVRVAVGEVAHGALGLDDVALEHRRRRVRPAHLLGEERRVVLLAAVPVGAGLEDHLADGRSRPAARREDVQGADDVVLVGGGGRGGRRVHDQARVDDRVDLGGRHDAPQQRVLGADPHVLGALEIDRAGPRCRRR